MTAEVKQFTRKPEPTDSFKIEIFVTETEFDSLYEKVLYAYPHIITRLESAEGIWEKD